MAVDVMAPGSQVPENTVVYATNEMAEPISLKFARQVYEFAPGQTLLVPYAAMCLWAGDPRSADKHNGHRSEQYRTLEWQRLRVKYGVYENEHLVSTMPKLKFTEVPVDGQEPREFVTVLKNPEEPGLVPTKDVSGMEQLKQHVAQLQAELAALQRDAASKTVHIAEADTPEVASKPLRTPEDDVVPDLSLPAPPATPDGPPDRLDD